MQGTQSITSTINLKSNSLKVYFYKIIKIMEIYKYIFVCCLPKIC